MCYFHEHFLGLAPLEVGLMTLEANWTPPTFTIKTELLFPFTKREMLLTDVQCSAKVSSHLIAKFR